MTTKYLTGAYPGGYTVQYGISFLDVEATASIGGTGIVGPQNAIAIEIDGTVHGTSKFGINIYSDGGSLVNGASNYSALIEGNEYGVSTLSATVKNFGTIEAEAHSAFATGVAIPRPGSEQPTPAVTNGSYGDTRALIKGFSGMNGDWSTVTNFGFIVGTGRDGLGCNYHEGSDSVKLINGSPSDRGAMIRGLLDGVVIIHAIADIVNYGIVSSQIHGVALYSGGLIENYDKISGASADSRGVSFAGETLLYNGSAQVTSALIEGVTYGIFGQLPRSALENAGPAIITNFGTILATGDSGYGVYLEGPGNVVNGSEQDVTALVEGAVSVGLRGGLSTLRNYGAIRGAASDGVTMSGRRDVLINGSVADTMASIAGSDPSMVTGVGDTVVNFGTISGLTLTSASSVLRVETGCAFESPVDDAGTLLLANGVGMLSSLGGDEVVVSGSMAPATFSGFGTLAIGHSARFTLTGPGEIAAGQTLNVVGVLTVANSLAVQGAVLGGGVIALEAGGSAQFDGAASNALTVLFRSAGSVLDLADPSIFAATIAGMVHYGKIDLVGIAADRAVREVGDKLVITDQGHAVARLQLAGSFGSETFATSSDGNGGTLISVIRGKGASRRPPGAAHALVSAAAGMGPGLGAGYAGHTPYASYGRPLLAAPRVQTA